MSSAAARGVADAPTPLPLYALLVGLSAGSALLGFAREATVAALLGASRGADALYAALALPFAAAWFLVGGALAPVLTARMAGRFAAREADEARALFRSALRRTAAASLAAAALLALFRHPVARLLVPGFDEAALRTTATLLSILGLYGVLQALALVVAAALNAAGRYRVPAAAVLLGNAAALGLLFVPRPAQEPVQAALALVGGVAVTLLVQLPSARAARLFARPAVRSTAPLPVGDTGLLLLALAALAAIDVLERPFASAAGAGAVAILAYAGKLLHLPMRLFAAPLAAVALPRLARRAADPEGSPREAGRTAAATLRLLLFAAAVTAGAAAPIAALAFGRGRFDADALSRLSGALFVLAPAVLFVGFFEMAGKLLVAEGRAARVALAHAGGLATYALAAPLLAPHGIPGLAAARDVAWGVSALVLAAAFARGSVRPFEGTLPSFAAALLAAPAAYAAASAFALPLPRAAAAVAAAGAVFAAILLPRWRR